MKRLFGLPSAHLSTTHGKAVVPNLFLTVAHFDFENFPWPHSQSIAQELDPNFPAKSVLS